MVSNQASNRSNVKTQYKYSLSSSNTLCSPEMNVQRDHSFRTTGSASTDVYSIPSHAHSFQHLYALPQKPYSTQQSGGHGQNANHKLDPNPFDRRPASLTKLKHQQYGKGHYQRSKSHQQRRYGH